MPDDELREQFRGLHRQVGAEDWINVIHNDDTELEARPVERQNNIQEGERITSDAWVIREQNGETYTVSEETFEEAFDTASSYHRQRFRLDLSWDDVDADDETVPTIHGATCYVYVDAKIDVARDSIVSMDVERVEYEYDNTDNELYDAIPMEAFMDSDMVAVVTDEEQ